MLGPTYVHKTLQSLKHLHVLCLNYDTSSEHIKSAWSKRDAPDAVIGVIIYYMYASREPEAEYMLSLIGQTRSAELELLCPYYR